MIVNSTSLDGCVLIKPNVHYDFRGEYIETFNEEEYKKILPSSFVQDDISVSHRHVLRGLHGDTKTWKLIQCLHGSIILAVVDYRNPTDTKFSWETFCLNDKNRYQVLVPPNFANGHLCLSDSCIFSYKQTEYYTGVSGQFSLAWNDKRIGIKWPIKNPLLSERDTHEQ